MLVATALPQVCLQYQRAYLVPVQVTPALFVEEQQSSHHSNVIRRHQEKELNGDFSFLILTHEMRT